MLGLVAATSAALLSLSAPAMSAAPLGPPSSVPPVTNYTADCSIIGLSVPLTVSTFDQAPGSVLAGRPVSLHAFRTSVSIPSSFVDLALSFGITSLSGTISTLDINATNATPATLNAAATPINFGPLPLTQGQAATFTVPSAPTTVGPWVAGNSGSVEFTPGDVELTVLLPISCTPAAPVPSLGTTVIR